MRDLASKKILKVRKVKRTHFYSAVMGRKELTNSIIEKILILF